MEDYNSIQAHNFSSLKEIETSPLAYRYALDNPRPDSSTFVLGRAFHCLTLEPERFNARYIVLDGPKPTRAKGPEWDAFEAGRAILLPSHIKRRSGKDWDALKAECDETGTVVLIKSEWDKCQEWADYLALVGTTEILTHAQYEQAAAMASAARSDEKIGALLELDGMVETVLEWTDHVTGEPCKGISDLYIPSIGALVDLKGWADISPRGLRTAFGRWATHAQLAFYADGLRALGYNVRQVLVAAVHKDAPHDTVLIRLSPEELDAGRSTYRRWIRRVIECREEDHWPGMYEGEIQEGVVPEWAAGMQQFTDIEV